MVSRVPLHSQLSSIMETMARSALGQISKLVDQDSAELRLEVSRLLLANSALMAKVNWLESELSTARSGAINSCKSSRSVGVQTVRHREGDPQVSGSPIIEAIFGKDWCMNLWSDSDPCHLDRVTDSPQTDESISGQITVNEVKSKDSVEGAVSSCQQETLSTEEHEECTVVQPVQLPLGHSADGSSCSVSLDQVESAAAIEDPSMQLIPINDTRESFSTYVIPIEDEEDVQFVAESLQEPPMNAAAGGSSNNQLQILPADNTENSTAPGKDSKENVTLLNVATVRAPKKGRLTCHICSRTFYKKGTLMGHMKSHKSKFCSICEQHFPNKTQHKLHTCLPSKKVRKSCQVCWKSFANLSALRMHQRSHTGEKPYTCSLCGMRFSQKGNMKSHLHRHTLEKAFLCGKCGKTFPNKAKLDNHKKSHGNP